MSDFALSIAEIAQRLDAELLGDGRGVIRRLATLETAGDDALAWLGSTRYVRQLAATAAAAVLVPPGDLPEGGPPRIRVPDPDLAMLTVSTWFAPPVRTPESGVHPTAWVAADAVVEGASIGPHCSVASGARVGPGSVLVAGVRIGADARVGADCMLRENVVIGDRCELGARVSIFPNATIGADGFGFLFRDGQLHRVPQIGTVVLEDDVEIGANTCVDRARLGVTRIGRSTKIDNLVQVAHNCDIGPGCILAGQVGLSGSVTLEGGCVLGGQVGVIDHVRVPAGTQVAAKAGVMGPPEAPRLRGIPADEWTREGRRLVALRRLPDALKELRALQKRVQQLESATHNSTRS